MAALAGRATPPDPRRTALLIIDVQNGIWNPAERERRPWFWQTANDRVLPNLERLIPAVRAGGGEVIHTVIESLTRDGRDRSLDYKLTGFHFPRGSHEAQVIDRVRPGAEDIVLPKTSSGVFNSTNIDYVLTNLGIETLVVTGFLTDQCVDHTVRDAADRGYRVVVPRDAATTETQARHDQALSAFAGYCRIVDTAALLAELAAASASGAGAR